MKLKELIQDDKNFNVGTEKGRELLKKSLDKLGAGRSILIDKNGRIIAGNKTTEAALESGIEEVIVVETTGDQIVAVKRTDIDLDDPKGRELALADNQVAKLNIDFDMGVVQSVLDDDTLREWDMITDFDGESDLYTKKLISPIYEPTGEKPETKELTERGKYNELIKKINASGADAKTKIFLKMAASRHIVFNYQKIAEFYAHAEPEIQELMEQSALVIVDFNKAIEQGYVQLTDSITNQYINEHGKGQD